jgi:hypothetical protein
LKDYCDLPNVSSQLGPDFSVGDSADGE